MTGDKFILIELGDERSKYISEVLGNETCKKIIGYLSEVKEASEKEISSQLNIPINTVEYNLNKLIKAELIEKSKNFFWSVKGKKIATYRLSNKKIIISPKSVVKGIAPVVGIVAAISFGIKLFEDSRNYSGVNFEKNVAGALSAQSQNLDGDLWLWFLLGGLVAILFFILFNYKKMKGGILK